MGVGGLTLPDLKGCANSKAAGRLNPPARRYADRYVEFDILEVAQRCGAQIVKQVRNNQWLARCPLCGDSANPKSAHLYLKRDTGEYYCHHCREGGFTVGFYAKKREIDTKTAYRELLQYVGHIPDIVFNSSKIVRIPENPLAPVERRHEVYTAMLKFLPLYPLHLEDLKRRGLPEEVIKRNGYKSYPAVPALRRRVADALADRFDLSGVPGFYVDKAGKWSFAPYPDGYFVPVRDPAGRIQGCQIRVLPYDPAKHNGKYTWFSSAGRKQGARASQWLHAAIPPGVEVKGRVWLTEGALKADIASYYLGVPFVASPGNCQVRNLLSLLESMGVEEVVMAYDADRHTNENVQREVEKLEVGMSAVGIRVEPAVWPVKKIEGRGLVPKGIDDACLLRAKRSLPLSEEVFLTVTETRTKKVTVETAVDRESVTVEETVTKKYEGRGILAWLSRIFK